MRACLSPLAVLAVPPHSEEYMTRTSEGSGEVYRQAEHVYFLDDAKVIFLLFTYVISMS